MNMLTTIAVCTARHSRQRWCLNQGCCVYHRSLQNGPHARHDDPGRAIRGRVMSQYRCFRAISNACGGTPVFWAQPPLCASPINEIARRLSSPSQRAHHTNTAFSSACVPIAYVAGDCRRCLVRSVYVLVEGSLRSWMGLATATCRVYEAYKISVDTETGRRSPFRACTVVLCADCYFSLFNASRACVEQ